MFRPPRTSNHKAAVALCCTCVLPWCAASGQNFTTQIASPDPLGFYGILPVGDGFGLGLTSNAGDGLKGGFAYGIQVLSVYDSNFFLKENNTKSELSTAFSPKLSYTTDPEGGAKFSVQANYMPNYRMYDHNSDLDGFDNSGDITLKVVGAKTELSIYTRYSELAGTDRLTGQFINGSLLTSGINANYQLAPRTSLFGSFSKSTSDYGTSSLAGADVYTTNFGAFWAATERFSFGPSLRYILSQSDTIGDRDAWSVNMQARYKAGERIQFLGSLGLEYAKNSQESGSNDVGLTGNLTAMYAINDRLVWRTSADYVTVPAPNENSYVINNFSFSTGLERQLTRGSVGIGVDLNLSNYESVGPVVGPPVEDEQNLSGYISYTRKFFLDRLDFETKLRYSANDGQVDWDQWQLSAGFELQF